MTAASISQDGNRLELSYADKHIWIEVEGIELPPLRDFSFAVWMLLPIAMQHRQPLHVAAAVDRRVLENARKLMQVWEMWLPETFRSVVLSADVELPDPIRAERTDARLFFYSGGGRFDTYAAPARRSDFRQPCGDNPWHRLQA